MYMPEMENSQPESSEIDDIPISALGRESRQWLTAMLDSKKVILSPSGYLRDWRGLSILAKIPAQFYSTLENSEKSPTERVLRLWVQYPVPDVPPTVAKLQEFVQLLDRWDVYDDTLPLIKKDSDAYRASHAATVQESVNELITYDDTAGHLRRYHAFILYAEADARFSQMMISELNRRGYMTCTREDLLLGFTTTIYPITRLINERCQHMIVIYSPDFLRSAENHFYMNFAQSISIKTDKRKIIPCMFRECQLPSQYGFMHMARYYEDDSRKEQMYNFWDKLTRSIDCSTLPRIGEKRLANDHRSQQTIEHPSLSSIQSVPSLTSVNTTSSYEDRSVILPSPPDEEPGESVRTATSLLTIPGKRKNLFNRLRTRLKGKKKDKQAAPPLVAA